MRCDSLQPVQNVLNSLRAMHFDAIRVGSGRFLGVQEVVGSNPAIPTRQKPKRRQRLRRPCHTANGNGVPVETWYDYHDSKGRMMPRPKNAVPQYLLHKPSGKARCRIDGRDYYLGPYGSEESRKAYADLIRQHFSGTLADDPIISTHDADVSISIAELVLSFVRHAETFYVKDGRNTSELDLIRSAVGPLVRLFGQTSVRDFGPVCLKAVRAEMVAAGWVRNTVNQSVGRIRRAFRYGVENELVPVEILQRLQAVSPLMKGKTDAPDRPRRSAVSRERINAVRAVVPEMVRDMIDIQELTGCRPGELLALTPAVIDRTKKVWVARLDRHKTEHHGHERRIYIGPRSQAILARYLLCPPDQRVFPMQRTSYARAISRGCEIAFEMPERLRRPGKSKTPRKRGDPKPPTLTSEQLEAIRLQASAWRRKHCWSPHWLRHTAASRIKAEFDAETAQAMLGHEKIDMTEHYSGQSHDRAIRAAERIG